MQKLTVLVEIEATDPMRVANLLPIIDGIKRVTEYEEKEVGDPSSPFDLGVKLGAGAPPRHEVEELLHNVHGVEVTMLK